MKCVLLAAGYATRLYPLTLDTPKSLLKVGSTTILERILAKVNEVSAIDEIVLVSNARFADQFRTFLHEQGTEKLVCVLDDGTSDNEHRRGAVADLAFAIAERRLDNDILVLAGDNLFDFSLADFVEFFLEKNADCITAYIEHDLDALRRTGVAQMGSDSRVLAFEEKPREPKSHFAVPPFYAYKRETLPLMQTYVDAGAPADAPGQFIEWLVARKPVYAFQFVGRRYDIGTLESYERAQRIFQ